MVTTSNLIFILSKPSGQSPPGSLRCCTTATFVLEVGLFILHPHKVRRRSLQSSSVFGLVAFLLLFSRPSLILVILANATSSHLKPRRPPLSPSSPPHSSSSSAQAEDPVRVSAFLPFQLTHNLKGAAAPLDSRVRGSDGVWGLRVDLSGFAISVVRCYFRYLPIFLSSSLVLVVFPNALLSALIPVVLPNIPVILPDVPVILPTPLVVHPNVSSSSLIPVVAPSLSVILRAGGGSSARQRFLAFSTNSQLERRCRATGLPPSRERRCVGSTRQRTYCLRGGIPLPLKGNRAPALNLACKKIENIYLNLRPPSAPSSCRL